MSDDFDDKKTGEGITVATDKDGIPILDEVVDSEQRKQEQQSTAASKGQGLNLPNRNALLLAMRKQLHRQIEGEIQQMAHQIAASAAKQLTGSIERAIWKELQCSLGDQLDKMLEKNSKSPTDGDN